MNFQNENNSSAIWPNWHQIEDSGFDYKDDLKESSTNYDLRQPSLKNLCTTDSFQFRFSQMMIEGEMSQGSQENPDQSDQQKDEQYFEKSINQKTGSIADDPDLSQYLENLELNEDLDYYQSQQENPYMQNYILENLNPSSQPQVPAITSSKTCSPSISQSFIINPKVQQDLSTIVQMEGQLVQKQAISYQQQKVSEEPALMKKISSEMTTVQYKIQQSEPNIKIQENIIQQTCKFQSKYWIPLYQRRFAILWKFINRLAKWQNFSKQSPDILVFLVCNFSDNLELQEWIEIVQYLNCKVMELDDNWYYIFNFKTEISLTEKEAKQVDELIDEQTRQYSILKQKDEQTTHIKKLFLKKDSKQVKQEYDFKETESFMNIQDKLDQSYKSVQDQEKQSEILQLKLIFKIQQNKKIEHQMKKTINFNQQSIQDCYKDPLIKKQVDFISDQIKNSSQQLLDCISKNSTSKKTYKTKNQNQNWKQVKKADIEHLKNLIQIVQNQKIQLSLTESK